MSVRVSSRPSRLLRRAGRSRRSAVAAAGQGRGGVDGSVPVMSGEDAVGWGLVMMEAALRGQSYSAAYRAVNAIVGRFSDAELREIAPALAVLVRKPFLASVRVEDVQNLRTHLAYLWGDD
jgi:hypothetical protein